MDPNQSPKIEDIWENAKLSEIDFWQKWIDTGGGEWPDEFKQRIDPNLQLQDYIIQYLDPARPRVRILDVGAGPLTIVGKKWPGHEVELLAVDALGDQYQAQMQAAGIKPLVSTRSCTSERLSDLFEANSFDLTHVRNALDHGYDPLGAIKQMIAVTRPGGIVMMFHFANEAENANYDGFHQWNFCVENRDMVIWNRSCRENLKAHIDGLAHIVSISPDGNNWVSVILRKKSGEE